MQLRPRRLIALVAALGVAVLAAAALAGCGADTHTGGASRSGAAAAAATGTDAAAIAPRTVHAAQSAAVPAGRHHCYASPKRCGFPDTTAPYPNPAYVGPHNATGPVRCSSLRRRNGLVTITRAGSTLSDVDIHGRVLIEARNVTLRNLCIEWDGSGDVDNPSAVDFEATGGRVIDSSVSGANATDESTQIALGENTNTGYHLYADHDHLFNCSECVHNDGWTVSNTFIDANGRPCRGYTDGHCNDGIDHVEDIYCDTGAFTVDHDTLINPEPQTADVFCNTDNGGAQEPCANQLTIEDSLLVGSGFMIYGCSNGVPVGSSHMTVVGNRFARCSAHPVYQPSTGGSTCTRADVASHGPDGMYPYGGYYGWEADSYCPKAGGQVWRDNRWDDTGADVRCIQDHGN